MAASVRYTVLITGLGALGTVQGNGNAGKACILAGQYPAGGARS